MAASTPRQDGHQPAGSSRAFTIAVIAIIILGAGVAGTVAVVTHHSQPDLAARLNALPASDYQPVRPTPTTEPSDAVSPTAPADTAAASEVCPAVEPKAPLKSQILALYSKVEFNAAHSDQICFDSAVAQNKGIPFYNRDVGKGPLTVLSCTPQASGQTVVYYTDGVQNFYSSVYFVRGGDSGLLFSDPPSIAPQPSYYPAAKGPCVPQVGTGAASTLAAAGS